jgi:hypothetical protein
MGPQIIFLFVYKLNTNDMKKIWIQSTWRERIVLILVGIMGVSGILSVACMAILPTSPMGFISVVTFCFSAIIAMGVAFA